MFVMLGNAGIEIVAVAERLGFGLQADARRDQPLVALAIMACDEQHRRHVALAIVVGRLQEHRRLAGIHRCVVEVELCHGALLSRVAAARGGGRRRRPRKNRPAGKASACR